MSKNQGWVQLLEIMYDPSDNAERLISGDDLGGALFDTDKALEYYADKLSMTPEETRVILAFMQKSGLIKGFGEENEMIILTEKGFDVAHKRDLADRQDRMNQALVLFTFILVLVNIVGNIPNTGFKLWGNVVMLGGVAALYFWTDVMDFVNEQM